jgi:hypothetical protein
VQLQHRRRISAIGLTPCAKTKDPWTQQLRACAHAHVPAVQAMCRRRTWCHVVLLTTRRSPWLPWPALMGRSTRCPPSEWLGAAAGPSSGPCLVSHSLLVATGSCPWHQTMHPHMGWSHLLHAVIGTGLSKPRPSTSDAVTETLQAHTAGMRQLKHRCWAFIMCPTCSGTSMQLPPVLKTC